MLSDLLTIAILAVLCGADGWEMVQAWGRGNLEWLCSFLELPHGIPSHDTFDRVFAMLDPLAFERCFNQWTAALVGNSLGLFVAVDGKTLRRSWTHAWSKTPVHLVSAFATQNQLVLRQVTIVDVGLLSVSATPEPLTALSFCTIAASIAVHGISVPDGPLPAVCAETMPQMNHGRAWRMADPVLSIVSRLDWLG